MQAISVNDTPVIGGTHGHQATTDTAPINPFASVTVADPDVGQTETATVTFAAANGIVTDIAGTAELGRFTVSGTVQYLQAALRGLTFYPTAGQAGSGGPVLTGLFASASTGLWCNSMGGVVPPRATPG